MAREHIISIWCDPCMEIDDVKTEGEEMPPISIGNQKPRVLALCKQHRTDFFEPLEEFVNRFGVLAEKLDGPPRTKKAVGKIPPPGPTVAVEVPGGYTLPRNISVDKMHEYRVVCPAGCTELQKDADRMASHLRDKHNTNLFEAIGPDGVLKDVDGNPVKTPKPRKRRNPHAVAKAS